jgi:hypothetical protein
MCDSGTNDKKVRCVKETRPDYDDGRDHCIWRLDKPYALSLEDLFEGADVGEKVDLELCEMTEAEIEALPEFEGW